MKGLFSGARLKLDRAKHHIEELSLGIWRFQSEHPKEVVIDKDPEPGYKIHKLRLVRPAPLAEFSLLIGDALNNMRSALDHATFACALANGHPKPVFKTCDFPFGKDAPTFNNAVNGRTSLPQGILALLRSFKAYKDGNHLLWALNTMCNLDKHALITPVVIGWQSVEFYWRSSGGRTEPPRNPLWDSAKAEIELFRTKDELEYDFHIALEIALYAPESQVPHRADALLNGFYSCVERILLAVEAEAARLGLVK
jgi:hypothetical protein